MVSATGPARAARADAAGPVEEEDEGYAATLAKERSAVPGSHAYQEQLQPGRDGEDPEDLDTDAVAESDQRQVRDPRREKNAPQTQVEDRENAHPFKASTRGAAYCTRVDSAGASEIGSVGETQRHGAGRTRRGPADRPGQK
jgi:hypothetical protein